MFVLIATVLALFSYSPVQACSLPEHPVSMDKQFPDPDINYKPGDPRHRGWAQYLTRSIYGTNKIALTFDDGPHPINTPMLLDILKKYQIKATFFTLGNLVKKFPKIAKRIVDEGHNLAGHDWTHDNSNSESERVFKEGVVKSVLAVKNFNHHRDMYYRFPYGAYGRASDGNYHHLNSLKEVSETLFHENCINFAFWDIDTADWVSNMTKNDIAQTLKAHFEGGVAYRHRKARFADKIRYVKESYLIHSPIAGGVALMHDIHRRSVEAAEIFIKWAKQNDIEFVKLQELREFEYGSKVCELQQKGPTLSRAY